MIISIGVNEYKNAKDRNLKKRINRKHQSVY